MARLSNVYRWADCYGRTHQGSTSWRLWLTARNRAGTAGFSMSRLIVAMLESWSLHREQEAAQGRAKDDVTRTHVRKQTSSDGKTPHASRN